MIKEIEHGIGYIGQLTHENEEKYYIILEYAPHRELFDYIYYPGKGFGETLGKAIFAQILNGVKSIHDLGYCHKDLSLSNIFLDENFISKVGDFGSAMVNKPDLKEYFQQINYKAPEVLNKKPHDGIKADIFSLGLILFILVFDKPPFNLLDEEDPLYQYIVENTEENIRYYWKINEGRLKKQISDEFKDLFIKMVLREPKERISIKEILNHPWMQSLYNLDKDKLNTMLWEEFTGRWAKVTEGVTHDIKHIFKSDKNDGVYTPKHNTKAFNVEESDFNSKKNPKVLDEDNMNKEYCIKIQDYFDANKLMNYLFDKLQKEFKKDNFEKDADKFKIQITFEEVDLVLKIKLYQLKNGLILKFFKVSGNKEFFLNKFDKIYCFMEEIIKKLD